MKKYSRLFLVVAFIVILVVLNYFFNIRQYVNVEFLKNQMHQNLIIGSIIFTSLFLFANLLSLPGIVFLIVGVFIFGKLYGAIFLYLVALLVSTASYFIIKKIGSNSLRRIENKFVQKIFSNIDQSPLKTVFILRLLLQTAPPLNYALALSGVSFTPYILGTALGLPLPIFLYVAAFDIIIKSIQI